mmetsp:Transcript_15443/g.31900  ORF Transcript_15443/g.31900 Transcript_15443/m.31900 type:complete len:224 (-) Transcript_15443:750-1421(-)|eukprot:CAMPEP_0172471668 /NCGR_PEP_ID=MMETSP1065-20121228/67937_1 /TAXON_ID=265537 /ORGANISM="Amphiprora paludosa, Strain CCMP125" /LENGTH=223 /DNA_ID=CAMNT_0013229779 /DNA_START=180 /DNA_END=851 /DNA_ORIENTATION=+
MMKLVSVLALAPSVALAFVVAPSAQRSTSVLFSERVDSSSTIQAALEATKKFGATSPEARVLWDAVEEMDGADNSVAYQGGLDTECEIEDDGAMSAACEEYDAKMQELSELMGEYEDKLERLKTVTSDLSDIKMKAAKVPAKSGDSPALRAAIKEATEAAKKASEEFGATSSEAKLAWETVEEVASSGLSNAMGGGLDQECLVEQASDACLALEELNKALKLN